MKYVESLDDMKILLNEDFINSIPRDTNIMITGCNGMIATYLIYFFCYLNDMKKSGINIYALTRNMEKTKNKYSDLMNRKDITFLNQDVNNKFDFDIDVDYLFHLASSADPKNIMEKPVDIIKANTIGLLNALDFAKEKNAKLIFASTREIYGAVSEDILDISESDVGVLDHLGARACYPESKKMAECLINSYNLQYDIPYTIFRIAHAYGPGMALKDGRVMSDLIGNVVNNEDIVLKSDGSQVRAFCYLSDLISAMLYGSFESNNDIYNVANEDEQISILNLSKKLVSLFPEKNLSVTYRKMDDKEKEGYCDFKRTSLNTDKIRNLGWKPKVKLKEGLKKTVNSFEKGK